ncbi:hypothetical protein JNB_18823 [Janibacter sp. HTCC2649]|nr:hypothetical protein JNB_18823 [Janibacter sp. HTCC2649]
MTVFLGAALLFMVQPMAAKLTLPSFGGSATVWSTSSLFFQLLLLLGYVYAHVTTHWLGARWQPRLHVLVLLLPLVALPIALPIDAAPGASSPILWLLRVLTLMVGLPFLVLSATGPLMQRWYAWSGGPRADDPYFLFAASNLGSFIGLLAYPFFIEPTLPLSQQRMAWSGAFVLFLAFMATCAAVMRPSKSTAPVHQEAHSRAATRPHAKTLLLWTFLAFVPSSMMIASTAHLTTDVAPIPLLWVLPLAAYLLSFVAAFARRSRLLPVGWIWAGVVVAIATGVFSSFGLVLSVVPVVIAIVVSVGLVGYAAHVRLAVLRPPAEQLTTYYLTISVGGALGGLLNGIVAPLTFNGVWEYLLTIALIPLLAVNLASKWSPTKADALRAVAGVLAISVVAVAVAALRLVSTDLAALVILSAFALATVGWLTLRTPVHLFVALLVAAVAVPVAQASGALVTERTFYGSYRVLESPGLHRFAHGTTIHGTQHTSEADRRTPTTYYAPGGPFSDILTYVKPQQMGVIGLGAGAIAAYSPQVPHIRFYEIDPIIAEIAADTRYFTYLHDAPGEVDVVVGDGRLMVAQEPEERFDLLVLDAFNSDSVPVHLLTSEAMRVYASHVTADGAIAMHLSSRVFDLAPVAAAAAEELGWHAWIREGAAPGEEQSSRWVLLAPNAAAAGGLDSATGWQPLSMDRQVTWTDDYSSVISVID